MGNITIYHNPRCSKSRATMALLEERNVEPEVVLYLEQPPTSDQLRDLLARLGLSARELMRTKETLYGDLGLADVTSEEALIEAMATHPQLIERPIVDNGERAALGRPPENVLELL